jgi:hypothetical protein
MATSTPVTGVRDEHYDLVSMLYHDLQGADTLERYVQDARQAGDDELAQFFNEALQENRDRAQRAKKLLAGRLA